MTAPAPLTEAEQAAASELQNVCWHTGLSTDPASLCGECDKVARSVTRAVRMVVAEEELRLLARLLRREVENESCAEVDDSGMKLAASFADDAADTCRRARPSLSRPTAEEK